MKYSEIFLLSLMTYVYLIILLRFLGKKEMSQLSVLDLIVFLIISELMTFSIGDENLNFWHSALAAAVIVCADKLCSYITMKIPKLKSVLEGHPTYIIRNGVLFKDKMKKLNYTVGDLCQNLREQGIGSISEVQFAILEIDGQLSVIEKTQNQVCLPSSFIIDGVVDQKMLEEIDKDEEWLKKELKKEGITDLSTIFYCVKEVDGWYYIKK